MTSKVFHEGFSWESELRTIVRNVRRNSGFPDVISLPCQFLGVKVLLEVAAGPGKWWLLRNNMNNEKWAWCTESQPEHHCAAPATAAER